MPALLSLKAGARTRELSNFLGCKACMEQNGHQISADAFETDEVHSVWTLFQDMVHGNWVAENDRQCSKILKAEIQTWNTTADSDLPMSSADMTLQQAAAFAK